MKLWVLLALVARPSLAGDGVVVRLGDAPMPPGVPSWPAAALVKALGLEPAAPRPPEDPAPALADLARGEKLYTQKGKLGKAVDALKKARARLPPRLAPGDRPAALRGLWLLAQLLEQSGSDPSAEAAAAIDHGLLVDPTAEPGTEDYSPKVRALFTSRREQFLTTARTIAVSRCSARVDGVESGAAGATLGPFPPGAYVVDCGETARWQHTVELGAEDARVDVPDFEADLTVDGEGLLLARDGALRDLATRVLAATNAPWVLAVASAPGGRLRATLFDRGAKVRAASDAMALGDAATWLSEALRGEPETTEPIEAAGATAPKRTRWWHWALIGGGAALAGTGGAFHALALQAADDMSSGDVDRRDDISRNGALYATFYALGGAALATGAVLAIIGVPDDAGTILVPGPGGVSVLGRF